MRYIAVLVAVLAAGLALAPTSFTAAPALAAEAPDVKKVMADRVLGNADAPVTIIELASLTCDHCASFHNNTLPELQKQALATGKAKLIFRDFPMDGVGLRASALARCLPENQYFAFIKMLFKQQHAWSLAPNPEEALTKLAALAGMAPDAAKACMNDTKILDALAQQRLAMQQKYKVNATPTFIFNDGAEMVQGASPIDVYMQKINKLTPTKQSTPIQETPVQ